MAELGSGVRIGHLETPNNLFLAPLAGYTDFAFRSLCYSFGAGLCFTEMVSAKGLLYNNENTRALLHLAPDEKNTAVQLFGSDPDILRAACESEALAPFPLVDLNMGCPVPKVFKNGEGSALLANFPLAERIVSACKKSGKLVSVKFRIGLERGKTCAAEFAKLSAGAGADMLTVHGRTRDMYYSGEPDYAQIAAAKAAARVPVIANGGVFTRADAEKMLDRTGADGVMIGRGSLGDPWLFERANALLETGICPALPPFAERIDTAVRQIELAAEQKGEHIAMLEARRHVNCYLKRESGVKTFKNRICALTKLSDLYEIADELKAFVSAKENI